MILHIVVLLALLIYNLLLFELNIQYSLIFSACLSFLICTYVIIVLLKRQNYRITFSTALLLYIMATQFGLIIPYAFGGCSILNQYSSYTLRFLKSTNLIPSMYLANMAVISYTLANLCVKIHNYNHFNAVVSKCNFETTKKLRFVAAFLVIIVLLYFFYHIIFRDTALFSTYDEFCQSSAHNSPLYSYILIAFYVATIYLASAGTIRSNLIIWIFWMLVVFIFVLNGNKGEFLYALLAVIGLYGVKGKKINWKTIVFFALILFLIIPFVTSFRNIGLISSFSEFKINFLDAFIEMGMQIRMSVYILDDISSGLQSFIYGRSYYQPIINILTFFLPGSTTATDEIAVKYYGYGFSQVIESYLNFGVVGILVFFFLIGYILSRFENGCLDNLKVAFIGTLTCILINATRNYFAFVPGHILIVSIIYFAIKKVRIKL